MNAGAERALLLPTRIQLLSLYKKLLKESNKMIIPNRKAYLVHKVKTEYRAQQHETEENVIIEYFRLGEVHLDSIKVQVEHLNRPFLPKEKQPLTVDEVMERREDRDPFADSDIEDTETKPTIGKKEKEVIQKPEVVLEYYTNTKE